MSKRLAPALLAILFSMAALVLGGEAAPAAETTTTTPSLPPAPQPTSRLLQGSPRGARAPPRGTTADDTEPAPRAPADIPVAARLPRRVGQLCRQCYGERAHSLSLGCGRHPARRHAMRKDRRKRFHVHEKAAPLTTAAPVFQGQIRRSAHRCSIISGDAK